MISLLLTLWNSAAWVQMCQKTGIFDHNTVNVGGLSVSDSLLYSLRKTQTVICIVSQFQKFFSQSSRLWLWISAQSVGDWKKTAQSGA